MTQHIYPTQLLDGRPALGLVAKRTYRIHGARLVLADEQATITAIPVRSRSMNPDAPERLVEDTDLAAHVKPATDVIVRGSAWAVRGSPRFVDTSVRVGPLQKHVRAWGDRVIDSRAGGVPAFSEAAPFESIPVTWDRAYGGRDRVAEARFFGAQRWGSQDGSRDETLTYPRNPSGRGFVAGTDAARLAGLAAPNLEDPARPLAPIDMLAATPDDWAQRPLPACYEPLDWLVMPRAAFVVPYAFGASLAPLFEALRSGCAPEMPPRDGRAYCCAPEDLSGARLAGNERVQLDGLHPRWPSMGFDLPGEQPRMILRPPGCPPAEVRGTLATVLIQPDAERVTLVWGGAMEVAAPYPREMCEAMHCDVIWRRA